jgi:hypothetical protein
MSRIGDPCWNGLNDCRRFVLFVAIALVFSLIFLLICIVKIQKIESEIEQLQQQLDERAIR